jgi:RNA polymerase sigma-70 factor (ECF subfamily)
MGKRLTRARTKIREANIPFSVPDRGLLTDRLEQVQQVIYLIFTEGHASATDASLVRGDLCDEALWLSELVARLVADDSETLALASLIRLTDARRLTRTNDDGLPILLEDQDRLKWDRTKIDEGLQFLARAQSLRSFGPLYFQASVAALHCTATSFSETNWPAIVALYDQQIALAPTSVLKLNRAAAIAYSVGPVHALREIDALAQELDGYVYFHSARAELLRRLGKTSEAIAAYDRALDCNPGESQRKFLLGRRGLVVATLN